MKKQLYLLFGFLILDAFCSTSALANQSVLTVSRFEFGKEKWPFNREEVTLVCTQDRALFALNPATLVQYPLNEKAVSDMLSGRVRAQPVSKIQRDQPDTDPKKKMSLRPVIERAERLCRP